jgi:uncharacterized protein (UPF0216 family)
MGAGFDKLMKAINFERTRSQQQVPRAKRFGVLIAEEDPIFESRDGTRMKVDQRDLVKISSILDEEQLGQLSLPVFIRTAPSLGHGFHQLIGVDSGTIMEKLHVKIVFDILGIEARNYLYGYEVQRLKREIPSLIFVFY